MSRFGRYRRHRRRIDITKMVCCILKADQQAGSPLLRGIAEKTTGIKLEAPKRIITAKRLSDE